MFNPSFPDANAVDLITRPLSPSELIYAYKFLAFISAYYSPSSRGRRSG
ncbi:hypothetical protein METHB2_600006 [Candidatus Methylobacter favarea]|uniref:Uncharacterized protein n=1 Tax=Candidatus Methylobacter favarea TaxID=2707345 RepID=A0A8S0WRR3_9GAMM|nr:hypothetical protein METHB2_600006 [Candidatus Methylobacter favarea]